MAMEIQTKVIRVQDTALWGCPLDTDLKLMGPNLTDEKAKRVAKIYAAFTAIQELQKFPISSQKVKLFALLELALSLDEELGGICKTIHAYKTILNEDIQIYKKRPKPVQALS